MRKECKATRQKVEWLTGEIAMMKGVYQVKETRDYYIITKPEAEARNRRKAARTLRCAAQL